MTYRSTHSYFIALKADGVYSYNLKVGGASWIPSEVVTMPEDCASEPTPEPTPTSTATPAPTESPVTTSAPEPTATGTAVHSSTSSDGSQPALISLSASTVTPRSALTVFGRGYAPGEAIEIWLRSTPIALWSGKVNADGTFSRAVTTPDTTTPGSHQIGVRAAGGSGSLNLTITPGLAVTGIESDSLLAGGALAALVLAADLSLMAMRRRATHV